MFYFNKRAEAREFKAKKASYKIVDRGAEFKSNRWGVKVI